MTLPFEGDSRLDPTVNQTTTGTDHPTTSHEAAGRVWPRTGTQRAKVLRLFYNAWLAWDTAWPAGFTDEEAQDRLGMAANSERPRRGELTRMGWLVDTGHKRATRGGDPAIIWQYAPDPGEKL